MCIPRNQIPNLITLARLVLSIVFFVILACCPAPVGKLSHWLVSHDILTHDSARWILPTAVVLFIIAAATDALDGYLARKWQVESRFGRIMDPVCDKVLILGSFIFLAGPNLQAQTGVAPWMVVVMLTRELLVTAIRSEMESAGVKFGANGLGKAKMILQSIAAPTVLAIAWVAAMGDSLPSLLHSDGQIPTWMQWFRDGLIWLTVGITAYSGIPYLTASLKASKAK